MNDTADAMGIGECRTALRRLGIEPGADAAAVTARLAAAGLDWDFLEDHGRDVLGRPGVRAHCAVWEGPAAGAERGPRWEGWSARGWHEALGMALACWLRDRS